MASHEEINNPETEMNMEETNVTNIDVKVSSDERDKIEIEMISKIQDKQKEKRPKVCDEESYIIQFFKSLMNSQRIHKTVEDKKK